MAFVRVEQCNARLAGPVRLEVVKGRDGEVAKGTVTIISNTRRGSGDERGEEATAVQWTLWGKQAENAAEYLGKGSRVNVVGRLRNNSYTDGEGREVYGMSFTCEELDYLDSKAEAKAKRGRQEWAESYEREQASAADPKAPRGRAPRTSSQGRMAAAN